MASLQLKDFSIRHSYRVAFIRRTGRRGDRKRVVKKRRRSQPNRRLV